MFYLRQATSTSAMLGPFVSSDGVGLVSLVISPQLIRLSKNGGNFAAKNLVASNAIHNENAYYSTIFDNTDTGSLGRMIAACSISTALPFWHEYTVLPTSVFDYMIQGSVRQDVNLVTWLGAAPNALVANRVDVSAGALANTVITSAAFAVGGIERMSNMLATDLSSLSVAIANRSPASAFRALRNRVTTSGTIITVYGEDDVTAVWTGAITTNSSADPIVEVDPA